MSTLRATSLVTAAFWCPACEREHHVSVGYPDGAGRVWQQTGTEDAWTLSPDVCSRMMDANGDNAGWCVVAVEAGQLVYRAESSHGLAGQTVPMVPLP